MLCRKISRKTLTKSSPSKSKPDRSTVHAIPDPQSSLLTASQSSDLATTSRCLITIVTICKEAGDWSLLNEQVLLLSKKHGKIKQAITNMVQAVMGFLDDTPTLETKLSVIETLRTVTEGKVRM